MKILLDDMSCLSPFYGVSGTILKYVQRTLSVRTF